MHHSLSHGAANRSAHPSPKLYAARTGDVTWHRWLSRRETTLELQRIEAEALTMAKGIPKRSDPKYRERIDALQVSAGMNQLLQLFRQLPDELRPIPPMTGPRALVFCLNLSGRMLRSTRR